jgi:hypothetical protein
MFYKCTSCQAEHDPPRPPQSNIMTHCSVPNCGAPVTAINSDTKPPPPELTQSVPGTAPPTPQPGDTCRSCGGPYVFDPEGALLEIQHTEDCDREPGTGPGWPEDPEVVEGGV